MYELPELSPGGNTVVFVGPTLTAAEVRRLIPHAVVFPPARFGDIYALIASEVDTIIIIDGLFHGHPPVWQREIALALAYGVTVVGAASMGALRALELAPYGMIGIGRIVRWYRSGEIEGDDEVALLHADEELGYLPLSLPLVDIRAVLGDAVLNGELAGELANAILCELKRLSHAERNREAVVNIARQENADESVIALLFTRFAPGYPSLKAQDARHALEFCSNSSSSKVTGELNSVVPAFVHNRADETMESTMMRAACLTDGRRIRLASIVNMAKRDTAECARLIREDGRRWFLQDWCTKASLGPDETERRRFAEVWLERHCLGHADVWLRENGMHRDDLEPLLAAWCHEAFIDNATADQLCLPEQPVGVRTRDMVLADWARQMGISPSDGMTADYTAVSQWLQDRTPAHFGVLDWLPDRALVQCLQVEGRIAHLASKLPCHGGDGG